MAQILNLPPTVGERFGTGLGSGIGKAINSLVENKIKEISARNVRAKEADAYAKALNLDQEQAMALTYFPEKAKIALLPNLLSSLAGAQSPESNESQEGVKALLQTEQQPKAKQPNIPAADLLQLLGQTALPGYQGVMPFNTSPAEGVQQQEVAQENAPTVQPESKKIINKIQIPKKLTLKDLASMSGGLGPKEKLAQQKAIDKETQPYVDKITNAHDLAEFANPRLHKMQNQIKKGGLPIATFYSLFNNLEKRNSAIEGAGAGAVFGGALGLGVPGATVGAAVGGLAGSAISPIATVLRYAQRQTSPNTEEFEKLSAEFVKGAKALFGNRITDADLQAFFAQIPTLANTDHGKKQIIHNILIANEIDDVKYNAMLKIIEENNGIRPRNLRQLVDKKTKQEVDKLTEKFESVEEEAGGVEA